MKQLGNILVYYRASFEISKTLDMVPKVSVVFKNNLISEKDDVHKGSNILQLHHSLISSEGDKKAKKVPNKSGKATKRKRGKDSDNIEEKDSKAETPSKKEKSDKKAKGSSKDKIPDVTAIDFSNNSKSPSDNPWNFKISSWNVNGIRAWLEVIHS